MRLKKPWRLPTAPGLLLEFLLESWEATHYIRARAVFALERQLIGIFGLGPKISGHIRLNFNGIEDR
jgi:hypothetical protein